MKPRVWIIVTLFLIVLATAMQIGGLVAPCWIWLKTSDFRVGVGLYFRVGCEASSGNNCTHPSFPASLPFGYNSASTYDEPEWEAMVWLQTISAIFALILCIMMIVYLIGFGVWRSMGSLNMVMVLTCILTWIVSVAGLIVFIVFYGDVITRSPDISRQSFPWSALLVFVAAILFIIIAILIRLRCRNRNYMQNAIPTSADSKMALNPSTKNHVMKRYFTPSPYREDRRDVPPAVAATDQSRLVMQSQPNNLGLHVNGNAHRTFREDLRDEAVIESSQILYGHTASEHGRSTLAEERLGERQEVITRHQHLRQSPSNQLTTVTEHSHTVLGDTDIDNRDTGYKYYTGQGSPTPLTSFSFTPGVSTDHVYVNRGFVTENIGRSDHVEQTTFFTKEVPVPPISSRSPRASISPPIFRVGADNRVGESFKDMGTTHMRRVPYGADRKLVGGQLVNGDGVPYSRTYMYRPYSEERA